MFIFFIKNPGFDIIGSSFIVLGYLILIAFVLLGPHQLGSHPGPRNAGM